MAAFDLAMFMWVLIFAPIYFVLGAPSCSVVLTIVGVILPSILVVLSRGYSPTVCGNVMCCAGWFTYFALVYLTGGLTARRRC